MSAGTHKPAEALHQQIEEPKSEALRLADECDESATHWVHEIDTRFKAAKMLRNQHARIAELEAHLAATQPAAQGMEALTPAARDVLAERQRQISAEGWTPESDDRYAEGDMSDAAGCYALHAFFAEAPTSSPPAWWPWAAHWWKPSTPRRDLEKAGALILAEIERIDRAALAAQAKQGGAA